MSPEEREELLAYADALEKAVAEMVAGKRKSRDLPIEPIARLVHFARTGTIRNASLNLDLAGAA